MKIDLHAHFIPREAFDLVDHEGRNYGPTIAKNAAGGDVLMIRNRPFGTTVAEWCDPEAVIRDMDKVHLDMRALSILPPCMFNDVAPDDGLSFCRRQNNALAEVVKAYPRRFVGIANLPMQDIGKSVSEMERAVRELGLKGVQIASNINGKNLDDHEFWPFYRKAQELDIPILVHPHPPDSPLLKQYFLDNTIGNPLGTTIAVASISYGGVLESFPRLKFVLAHAGGFTPFIRGRWDQGYQFYKQCQTTPRPPGEYLKLMYFDTVIHFGPALSYLVNTVGADRVVLGSDYCAPIGIADPVNQVRNAAGISAADKEQILEITGAALLKLA